MSYKIPTGKSGRKPFNLINSFLDKLTGKGVNGTGDKNVALVDFATSRRGLQIPMFAGVVSDGDTIGLDSFPNYYIVWQGQTTGNSFMSEDFANGRLEIFYNKEYHGKDNTDALQYLLAVDESVKLELRSQRMRLGCSRVENQQSIPTVKKASTSGGGEIKYIELRAEYGISIRR